MKTISLDGENLTIEDVVAVAASRVAFEGVHVEIAAEAQENAIMYPHIEAVRELVGSGELVQAVEGAIV